MLKKVTGICALILVACLIAGIVFIPLAVRDFLKNGDRMISNFIHSSEIYRFDAQDLSTLELHFGSLPVYLEQSNDSNVYLRMEGLFTDRYAIADGRRAGEEKNILSLSIDSDALFFDTGSPYLLRSGILGNSAAWVIVRVPSWISVETANSPWNIQLVDNVQFENRDYYSQRLWNREEGWEVEQKLQEDLNLYRERFQAMKAVYEADLQKSLYQLEAGEINLTVYNNQLDEAAENHLNRMAQKLFPDAVSALYDREMLMALLGNYIDLSKGAARQQGLMREEDDAFSDRYYELQNRYAELQDASENALSSFLDYYEAYLSDLAGQGDLGEAVEKNEPPEDEEAASLPLSSAAEEALPTEEALPAESEPLQQTELETVSLAGAAYPLMEVISVPPVRSGS